MATRRKQLKYCNVILEDGFAGTSLVNDTAISASDTTLEIDTNVFTDSVTIVPVGARFRTAGINTIRTVTASNNSQVWTVTVDATGGTFTLTLNSEETSAIAYNAATSAVQAALEALASVTAGDVVVTGSAGTYTITLAGDLANSTGNTLTSDPASLTGGAGTAAVVAVQDGTETWAVTFTPAIASGSVPANNDVITWTGIRLTIKSGSGTIEWTETDDPIFDTDRDVLDSVREGVEQPMQVTLSTVFDWIRSSTGDAVTPYEVLHQRYQASTWQSAAETPCEPYCVTLIIEDLPPCGSEEAEVITFPYFYKTSVNPKFSDGLVAITGKCKATRPNFERLARSVVLGT